MELYNRTKANLKGKLIAHYEVDYGDLEDLILKTYGVSYSFQADMECGNDSSHDFSIRESETLGDYDKDKLRDFIDTDGKKMYMTRTLLIDMYNKGILSSGNYLIQISY